MYATTAYLLVTDPNSGTAVVPSSGAEGQRKNILSPLPPPLPHHHHHTEKKGDPPSGSPLPLPLSDTGQTEKNQKIVSPVSPVPLKAERQPLISFSLSPLYQPRFYGDPSVVLKSKCNFPSHQLVETVNLLKAVTVSV